MSALYNVDSIRKVNEHGLRALAQTPHAPFLSGGQKWLTEIRDTLADYVDYEQSTGGRYNTDAITEDADALVPVYAEDVWAVFTDLRAWEVDLGDYVEPDPSNITGWASTALFVIAERLIVALLDAAVVSDDAESAPLKNWEKSLLAGDYLGAIAEVTE